MIIKRCLTLQEEKHEKKKGTPFKHDLLKTFNVVNKNSSLGLRKEKKEYFYKVIIPLLLFLLPLIRSYHDPRVKLIVSKEHHAPFYEDYSIEAKKKNRGTSHGSSTGTKKVGASCVAGERFTWPPNSRSRSQSSLPIF